MVVYNLLMRNIGLPFGSIYFYLLFLCTNLAQEQTVAHCIRKCGYLSKSWEWYCGLVSWRNCQKTGSPWNRDEVQMSPLKYYCSVSLFIMVFWAQYSPKEDQHSCDLAICLSWLKHSDEQHLKTTLPFHHQGMAPALSGTAHLCIIAEMGCVWHRSHLTLALFLLWGGGFFLSALWSHRVWKWIRRSRRRMWLRFPNGKWNDILLHKSFLQNSLR